MKNFLRALRHAWPYRRRLVVSVLCAIAAAAFWGLSFTSIYPVLKLLHTEKTPQEWIEKCIADTELELQKHNKELNELKDREEGLKKKPREKFVEQQLRDNANDLARLQSKISTESSKLYYYEVAQRYIDRYVPPGRFETLAWVIALVVVGVAVKCFFEFAQESLVGSVVNLSLYDLRNRFYRNAIHLDVDQFGEHGSSELMARFTNDVESLGAGIKTLFGKVVAEPLRALSCVVIACYINWQLTLMFLVLVPIAAFILAKVGRIMKQATRRLLERMSKIYKILQETFQGIRVVKAFTMEPHERRRFRAATRDYYHKAMLVVNIDAATSPVIEVLGVAAVALALLVGSYLVVTGETGLFGVQMASSPMEPETLLNLYLLLAAIADPVRKLSSVLTRIQSGCAAADRIFAFVDRVPRVRSNSDGPRLHPPKPDEPRDPDAPPYLEFRDVCFSYEPDRAVLSNIRLTINAGETVAVVGPNGSGKTTLLGLIPRFYDPNHGSVLIDGHDLRVVNLRSLRQQIGIVTQDTILFDDTIVANIRYGSHKATQNDVEAAARRAFVHDFIESLPKGYQTRVGEFAKMSGGQKQRIALARAILRDPAILILDEFTSQYDPESEALINRALKEFVRGRTTFVITHRLHTLELANRIIVLENGRLAAIGTHAELMATCAPYQRLQDAHRRRPDPPLAA
jgi:ATP-binding cassette subfamily B protein/subfamily B ATP-binding cassette protein MsbA